MSSPTLESFAWKVCCDFHDHPDQIQQHLEKMKAEYGVTSAGEFITPPDGWVLIPYRAIIRGTHREYIDGIGWAAPRREPGTITPIFAKPVGKIRVFAAPKRLRRTW